MHVSKRIASTVDIDFIYTTKKESLYEYVDSIWGWDERFQRDRFNENLCLENIRILVDTEGNRIGILETEETSDSIHIVNIELASSAQNMGIGSKVISDILTIARSKRKSVLLRVFKLNRGAIRFYHRHGFIDTGQSEHHLNMMADNTVCQLPDYLKT